MLLCVFIGADAFADVYLQSLFGSFVELRSAALMSAIQKQLNVFFSFIAIIHMMK